MKTPAQCREEAEDCRALAAKAGMPEEKTFWMELAQEWLDIAADLEIEAPSSASAPDPGSSFRS